MNLVKQIKNAAVWSNMGTEYGHKQNTHLEFGAQCIMAHSVGVDVSELGDFWLKEIVDKTEVRRGLFKRTPKGYPHHNMSLSHDELLGIACASYLFDAGLTARRILDEGTTLGFYFSGFTPISPRHQRGNWFQNWITRVGNFVGKYIDSEWFILMRPLYRGYLKLAAGRELTPTEYEEIKLNLLLGKTWNILDVRCVLLEAMDRPEFRQHVATARRRMGTNYRGRYGRNPIYLRLWELRDNANSERKDPGSN